MWQIALKDVLLNIVKIVVPAPFIGYAYLFLVESGIKAWKGNNKRKLWLIYSSFFALTTVSLKYLYWAFYS